MKIKIRATIYLCMFMFLTSTYLLRIDANTTGAVKNGDSYYKIFTDTCTWEQAKAKCQEMGGHLATITSTKEQKFVESLNSSNINLWIGGYKNSEGKWCWVTGEKWEYQNWEDGEPNNSSNVIGNERFIAVWPQKWNDLANTNTYEQSGFICEWKATILDQDKTNDTYIKINKNSVLLSIGTTTTLKLTLTGITGTVKWSSSNSSVATVSASGIVTAKKAGTATITARVGSYKATCKVTVSTSKINNKRSEVKITSKVNGHVLSSKYCDSFFDSYSTKTTCVTENNSLLKISALGAASTYSCTSISTKNFLEKCGFTYNKKFTGSGNSSSLTQNDNCIIYTGEKRVNVLSPTAESKRTIAIVISGYSKNGYEWISNFNIGLGNVHSGFSKAANKVIEYIDNEYKPRKNDIIWIMGHSRGAAITNLVADHYITNGFKNIYAYGFATPNVSTKTKKTNRILNIINSGDFVPYVPLSNWGYSKNGTNRTFTMNSDMKELFKAYTGKSVYKGMSKKENSELLNHFNIICNGSKSGYFVTIKPSSIQGIKLISPKLYMQSGVALLMNDKESVKNTGITLMVGYSVYSHSYAFLTSHLALEQAVNPKIFDAHCMETYLAIVNGAVPSV